MYVVLFWFIHNFLIFLTERVSPISICVFNELWLLVYSVIRSFEGLIYFSLYFSKSGIFQLFGKLSFDHESPILAHKKCKEASKKIQRKGGRKYCG